MTVSSHVDRGINFARYRTYDWGPADALPTGDPRLDKNPFFKDHVKGAVEKQLAARGLEMSTSGTPVLLIHYHASFTERIDAYGIEAQYGSCDKRDCEPYVSEAGNTPARLRRHPHQQGGVAWLGRRQRGRRD